MLVGQVGSEIVAQGTRGAGKGAPTKIEDLPEHLESPSHSPTPCLLQRAASANCNAYPSQPLLPPTTEQHAWASRALPAAVQACPSAAQIQRQPWKQRLSYGQGHAQRTGVVLMAKNIFKKVERDLLPNGKPNTPVRRLSYSISHALTLEELDRVGKANRHKATNKVWLPKHEAAMLIRAAALVYPKAMAGEGGKKLATGFSSFLRSISTSASDSLVLKLVGGTKLAQLLVAAATLPKCVMPAQLSQEILRELLKGSAEVLHSSSGDRSQVPGSAVALLPSSLDGDRQATGGFLLIREGGSEVRADLIWALAVLRSGFTKPKLNYTNPQPAFKKKASPNLPDDYEGSLSPGLVSQHNQAGGTRDRLSSRKYSFDSMDDVDLGEIFDGEASPSPPSAWKDIDSPPGALGLGPGLGALGLGLGPGSASYKNSGVGMSHIWLEIERVVIRVLVQELAQQEQHMAKASREAFQGGLDAALGVADSSGSQALALGLGASSAAGGERLGLEALARIAWGMSTAGRNNPEVYDLIESLTLSLPIFSAPSSSKLTSSARLLTLTDVTAVANMLHAFATAGRPCPMLMPKLSLGAGNNPNNINKPQQPQQPLQVSSAHVAKVLWATATLGYRDGSLLRALVTWIPASRCRFTGEELCSVAWAYAEHGFYKPPLFAYLGRSFVLQKVGHADRALFNTISRLASGRLDTLNPRDCVSITWALAVVRQPSGAIFEAAARSACQHIRAISARDLSDLLWALGVAEMQEYCRQVIGAVMNVKQGHSQVPYAIVPKATTGTRASDFTRSRLQVMGAVMNVKQGYTKLPYAMIKINSHGSRDECEIGARRDIVCNCAQDN
eukprot:gene5848-6133_t